MSCLLTSSHRIFTRCPSLVDLMARLIAPKMVTSDAEGNPRRTASVGKGFIMNTLNTRYRDNETYIYERIPFFSLNYFITFRYLLLQR